MFPRYYSRRAPAFSRPVLRSSALYTARITRFLPPHTRRQSTATPTPLTSQLPGDSTPQENRRNGTARVVDDGAMGFPVGYSEMTLPRVLLHVLLFLGHLHRFLVWAFHAVGLGDLIDLGANYYPPQQEQQSGSAHGHHAGGGAAATASSLQNRRPEFRAVPAVLIDEALPVVRFEELAAGTACGGDCAVCLCGIGAGDEVRRLGNCRHAFHRGCLDRWMAHDQRTCPLCRAPLLPGDLGAPAPCWPVDDAADHDPSYPSSLLSPSLSSPLPTVPTPTLLRPHELLLTGLGGFQ